MSSKSAAYPVKPRSLLNQDLDGILNERFIYNRQAPGSPPVIDLKVLVDNYFRENSKRIKKNVGYLWDEKTSMCNSKDFDEKSYSVVSSATQLNDRYKTELCRPFTEEGQCKYGSKCQYAHGTHELRPTFRHMKHKTKLCHKFHSTGFCNYGSRCTYIHNEEDDMNNKVNSISPPPISVANNAFSFPPLVRLPSISSSSSSDSTSNSFESRNSSPISFDGNNFTFAPSPYFAANERAMNLPQYSV